MELLAAVSSGEIARSFGPSSRERSLLCLIDLEYLVQTRQSKDVLNSRGGIVQPHHASPGFSLSVQLQQRSQTGTVDVIKIAQVYKELSNSFAQHVGKHLAESIRRLDVQSCRRFEGSRFAPVYSPEQPMAS